MALKLFRQTHIEYLWLHFLMALVLIFTSVFWFVLPYFIISYGTYSPSIWLQTFLLLALFILPSLFITVHCWFINFQAAQKWKTEHPHENIWRWFFRFQSFTFIIVITFTAIIYSLLFIIDQMR
ncbi:hypothetical protein [Solibacillus sp. FSL K6-1523]|uniref:hypothetical protein n=1 Tax=Solibacillus sp. FSL K6-1523 TaxID=2921471 RepID=UPI0030FC1B1C